MLMCTGINIDATSLESRFFNSKSCSGMVDSQVYRQFFLALLLNTIYVCLLNSSWSRFDSLSKFGMNYITTLYRGCIKKK